MKSKSSGGSGNAFDRLRTTYRFLLRKEVDTGLNGIDLSRKVRDTLVSPVLREEMAENLEYAIQLGLCVGKLSEASIHIQANQYLVTKRDCSFSYLLEDDFLLITPGSVLNQNLTPHYWNWQQKVYQSNSQARAILLGQPLEVMALAAKGELPDSKVLVDAVNRIGDVVSCDPDVELIGEAAAEANLIIVPGIGVLSWADSLLGAVENMAILDRWSGITIRARS